MNKHALNYENHYSFGIVTCPTCGSPGAHESSGWIGGITFKAFYVCNNRHRWPEIVQYVGRAWPSRSEQE